MPKIYEKANARLKPDWLKIKLPEGAEYAEVAHIVERNSLHTICSSGKCPNRAECWSRRTATFMILGDICTRCCKFCATDSGRPLPADESEPAKVALSIRLMGLKHAVITSVTRDDMPDEGAAFWARTVREIRRENPDTTIEVLIPDMNYRTDLIDTILASAPDIVGHNIETVERITPLVRSRAKYRTSLQVLKYIADHGAVAKSGIMVGLGETHDEVLRTLDDLAAAGVSIVTLGQYLRPTLKHLPVDRYVAPEEFDEYKREAYSRGFRYVASAPLVRSSYMAEQALTACGKNR